MGSRYRDDWDERAEESARPTRFWRGAQRAEENERSGSLGDEGLERYGDRYRNERSREYPQSVRSPDEAEQYYGAQERDRRYRTSPQYGGRHSSDYSRQYLSEAQAGDSHGGAWTGRQQHPSGSYGRQSEGMRATGHRGKGPKGYERTDERLKELICERLTDDDSIDAGNISVNVTSGRVTLEGTVDSRQAKYDIEECAEQCGAREILNNLRIERDAGGSSLGQAASAKEARGSAKGSH